MTTYTYLGPETAYFPALGRTLAPGDTADLDANPGDGRWTPPDAPPAPDVPPLAPTVPVDPPDPTDPGTPASEAAVPVAEDHQEEAPSA